MNEILAKLRNELLSKTQTLSELVEIAGRENISLSTLVAVETMAKEKLTYEQVLSSAMNEFEHNFKALDVGLTWGQSFLLGKIGTDLAHQEGKPLIDDSLINNALIYTLATEVGNHEIGLRPCAGTGDSCPYTGLIKALQKEGYSQEKINLATLLILKVGSIFRSGKQTTGCNMEGYGAGSAATAAALTDLKGGTPRQVAKAIVLALSPTIGVPCTPRVMVSGLCAAHIGGAILIGNLASNLILKTSLPVDVDVDVMIAMAAKVHVEAAPVITSINLDYLGSYFRKNANIENLVDDHIRKTEEDQQRITINKAREEVRQLIKSSRPLTQVLGDVIVGGSSIAVGSPTNMARICHDMISGEITEIEIELTTDLFSRRAINVPAILMGAIYGANTDNIELYRKIFDLPEIHKIKVTVNKIDIPEIQRIRITATEKSAMLDARNRGGGRVAIVAAEPSIDNALTAASKLGIEIVK